MAVNSSRSMTDDFTQGTIDSTYISIVPDRGGVLTNIPSERLRWPNFVQAEVHDNHPAAIDQSVHMGKHMEHLRR